MWVRVQTGQTGTDKGRQCQGQGGGMACTAKDGLGLVALVMLVARVARVTAGGRADGWAECVVDARGWVCVCVDAGGWSVDW